MSSRGILSISNLVLKASLPATTRLFIEYVHQENTLARARAETQSSDGQWIMRTADITVPMEAELLTLVVYEEHNRRKLGSAYLDLEDLYNNHRTNIEVDIIPEDEDTSAVHVVFDAAPYHPPILSEVSTFRNAPPTLNLNVSDEEFVKSMDHLVSMSMQGNVLPLDSTVFNAMKMRIISLPRIVARIRLLSNLAGICDAQFLLTSKMDDYVRSRGCYETASVESSKLSPSMQLLFEHSLRTLPDKHPRKSLRLQALGNALTDTFNRDLLQRGISLLEEAERVRPFGAEFALDRLTLYVQLAKGYRARFEEFGDIADLDRTVSIVREALAHIPPELYQRQNLLNTLGLILVRRFQIFQSRADLDEGLKCNQEALDLAEKGSESYIGYANNRALAVFARFKAFGDAGDLEEVIRLREEVLRSAGADHNARRYSSCGLATALYVRFTVEDRKDDLERAIVIAREECGRPQDPMSTAISHLLGLCLVDRASTLGNPQDLDAGIDILRRLSDSTPAGSIDEHVHRISLGVALLHRYHARHKMEDAQDSARIFAKVSQSSGNRAYVRLMATMYWQSAAEALQDRPMRMMAIHTGMDILPTTAWLGLPLSDRHNALMKPSRISVPGYGLKVPSIAELPTVAASYAIEEGDFATAIEWLEQGRSVVWGQMLQLRAPFDALRNVDAELAKRLEELSRQLSTLGTELEVSEVEGQRHRRLASQWEEGLARARSLPGLEKFLLPKVFGELVKGAVGSVVVIVNVCARRCDALVVLGEDVMHVALPLLSAGDVKRMHESLRCTMAEDFAFRAPSRAGVIADFDSDDAETVFEELLGELWFKVTQPVLHALAIQHPSESPSVQLHWCPTGELAFLPLHAAGDHTKPDMGNKVYDFVVSSYTPTLSALLDSQSRVPIEDSKHRVLAVAVSSPTGQVPIPGVSTEVSVLSKIISPMFEFISLSDSDATPKRVLEEIKNATWMHFACHAVQHPSRPIESALLLTGSERLMLSDIIRANLPYAELAFLSACQTASGDEHLPSESLHLAAGMLLAGFRGVVATMWSIEDGCAPGVAGDVYGGLLEGVGAARALRCALEELRGRVGERNFLAWVPYVHFGV